MTRQALLTINAGSSSLKSVVFEKQGDNLIALWKVLAERLNTPEASFKIKSATGDVLHEEKVAEPYGHKAAFEGIYRWIDANDDDMSLIAVGHRVVHGGDAYAEPKKLTQQDIEKLKALTPLAPLHQPYNLTLIETIHDEFPNIPQVACFDTAFHQTQPLVHRAFGLPKQLLNDGVKRYGFHGLSYEYIAKALAKREPQLAEGKIVVAHLGQGASLCGMENGKSVDTSMGFTALDGLMMGTRCGRIDPGVLLHLIKEYHYDYAGLEKLLYKESGLKGVSGESNDMRDLLASDSDDAKLAIDLFVYRICFEIGAMAASLQGIDGLVFTAGIGENAAEVRQRICQRLAWLGCEIDAQANHSNAFCINTPSGTLQVRVMPTNEERMIAEHTVELA